MNPSTVFILLLLAISTCSAQKGFIFSSEKANFFQAFLDCKQAEMDLASVTTPDEQKLLYSLYQNNSRQGEALWLGGSNLHSTNNQTKWHWYATGDPIIFADWHMGQPDNDSGQQHCLTVTINKWQPEIGHRLGYDDDFCTTEFRYVCMYNVTNCKVKVVTLKLEPTET